MSNLRSGRVPPKDLEAERACIGAALLNRECCQELADTLTPADFYSEANGIIWECIVQLVKQYSAVIDTVMVCGQLGKRLEQVGGDEYLMALTDTIPTLDTAQKHARRVRELAAVREIITRCHEVSASGYGDIDNLSEWLDDAENKLGQPVRRPDVALSVPFAEVVATTFEAIQKQSESGSKMIGVSTGLQLVDQLTRGFAPGNLVICAGRPGMGKSAFAGGVVKYCGPSAVFSLEMPGEEWARRHLSGEAKIDGRMLRGGNVAKDEWGTLARAAAEAMELPIAFWDRPRTTVRDIAREARRVDRELRKKGERLKLVVVDYIQLLKPTSRGRSREEEVSEASRELKSIAMELQCAVLALAQLNRNLEQRPSKRPQLSDLRESGAIEQDADIILFIYRDFLYNDEADPNVAEIIIGKQRAGPTGTCEVAWLPQYTVFENLEWKQEWTGGRGYDASP